MERNPIQFAIVREDPRIELELIRGHGARRVLLVASGGCTALTLKACQPELEITLVDSNPAQIELVRRKIAALSVLGSDRIARENAELCRRFGIGNEDPGELTACGNFEALFRQLRVYLYELVAPRERWLDALTTRQGLATLSRDIAVNRHWRMAFEHFFSDALLVTTFGREAVQHAEPGSYSRYFQKAFDHGLGREDALENRWLHHALLGHYLDRPACLPEYLVIPVPELEMTMRSGPIEEVDDLDRFDLVSLSNVMDWMSVEMLATLTRRLRAGLRPGAVLLYRQLNHREPFDPLFAPAFDFDPAAAGRLLAADRSLFYSHLAIATRKTEGA